MKQEKRNIEDFLKDKLDGFDAGYQNDWSHFETKLDRAILYYRLKVGALIGVVLLLITLGIAGGEGLSNFTNADNRSAATPAFFHSLRQRAPFMLGNRGGRVNRQQYTSSTLGIGEQHSSIGNKSPLTKTKEYEPTKLKDQAAPGRGAELLSLNSKSPRLNLVPAGNPLSAGSDNSSPSAVNKSADINHPDTYLATDTEDENASDLGLMASARAEEFPLIIDNDFSLDREVVYAVANNDSESDLDMRPVIKPVKFKKAPAYISPLQAESPWSYSVSVYPNFTFRKFKVDREKLNLIHRDFIDATQEAESGGFSLNVGFVVSRRIGRITYLNGGVEYINYKAVAEYDFYNYREANIDPQTDQILNYSLLSEPEHINFSGNNVYHYVNFPLSISHKPWATDHVRLNIEAGGSFMYFLGASGQAIDYQSLEIIDIADREYNNSIASLHMKVGVSYYVSQRFNVGLEPTLMYFTNTIYSEDYPFQVIPYSVGVNFKLQVKLN